MNERAAIPSGANASSCATISAALSEIAAPSQTDALAATSSRYGKHASIDSMNAISVLDVFIPFAI